MTPQEILKALAKYAKEESEELTDTVTTTVSEKEYVSGRIDELTRTTLFITSLVDQCRSDGSIF